MARQIVSVCPEKAIGLEWDGETLTWKRKDKVKALLQRVTGARVSVAGEEVGRIGQGLMILVGIACGDEEKDVRYLLQKAVHLRILLMRPVNLTARLWILAASFCW